MSFKERLSKYYADSFLKKYNDRITQVQGNVISVKVTEKSILGIFNKLSVSLIIKPERSKSIIKCFMKRNRWFKKPTFMAVSQGNMLIVQGLKGKKGKENREQIQIMNIRNLTTRKDLIPIEGGQKIKRVQQKYKH